MPAWPFTRKCAAHLSKSTRKLVAVLTNAPAVLGLGSRRSGWHAVIEGKAVLFKGVAGVDVFDCEVNSRNPTMCPLVEPTFGGIILEDIKDARV